MEEKQNNPLGSESIGTLIARFAIPSIIAMLVSSLYNIVDQFFIGRSVGMLGNAATNVAFPLSITCTAISLLCGIGGAANFNLAMGRKEKEKAVSFAGGSIGISGFPSVGRVYSGLCRSALMTTIGANTPAPSS